MVALIERPIEQPERYERSGSVLSRWLGRLAEFLGWPIFWVVLVVVLLVPTACFLILAVSPRLFDQGSAWFTVNAFREALTGVTLQGMADSLVVGILAALLAVAFAILLAWLLQRTNVGGRRVWSISIWAVLLVPSYIIAVGWQVVLGPGGVLAAVGLYSPIYTKIFFGPVGYTLVLAIKGLPFAYFAVAGSIAALGSSFEDAARVHGGGRLTTLRVMVPMILPSIFAGLIVVFAESIADFGTAAVIAPNAHFPIATYNLYVALSSYPANFGVAAVIGLMLVVAVAVALTLQKRFLKSRSYAVLGGRTRSAKQTRLTLRGQLIALGVLLVVFFVALGVPILGALVSSMLKPFATLSLHNLTLSAYRGLFGISGLGSSLGFSFKLAVLNGFLALILGTVIARRLSRRGTKLIDKLLDVTVLAAIALPGLVLAAGYIFAYNLPILSSLGIDIYGTVLILIMAYLAGALPSTTRVLAGPLAQVKGSLLDAGRVHGAGLTQSWWRCAIPLLGPSLLWAWLLTFAATFLELPASELLAPPGTQPVAVAIISVLGKSNLSQGTALSIVALLIDLGMIIIISLLFRFLAPKGWRRLGANVL
ncbi:MAG: ABC transporter permease [Ferrimicrobium sp.]